MKNTVAEINEIEYNTIEKINEIKKLVLFKNQ